MKNRYLQALLSSTLSIVPMILIVLILSWTGVAPLNFVRGDYLLIILGTISLISGLAIFQIGASRSLSKVGEYMGSSLSKQKNLFIVILFAFALGTLITMAEPSIMIVSKQVNINPILLIGGIAIGVGVFVVIGVLRIIFHKNLKLWYLLFYAITFMLLIFVVMDPNKKMFLPFIFDSGGVTTGSATVPFILSLGAGIAIVRGGKSSQNDSFGLVGMASIGPIMTVAIMIIAAPVDGNFVPTYVSLADASQLNIAEMFANAILPLGGSLGSAIEVLIAMAPTLIIFLIYNFIFLKLPAKKIIELLIGFLFAYIGLTIFLGGTSAAMTPIGNYVGTNLGEQQNWVIILVAFIIGLVTILCEPAVHVLTNQIEQVSDGQVRKVTVLIALSLGVGVAIALASIRAIFNFSIMFYMIPGYIISLVLMFLCPDIFTAIAFDSGGTASGPMSSSFVLPLLVGIVTALKAKNPNMEVNYYEQAFGLIALIALTPVIAIQILGVAQNVKRDRARISILTRSLDPNDAQVIHFN